MNHLEIENGLKKIVRFNLSNEDFNIQVFNLLCQLRPHLTRATFAELFQQMSGEGYVLWAYLENQKVLGLVSTRVYSDFVRGKHVYIDDLVTDSQTRSKGIGATLLAHVEEYAKGLGLQVLRLSCVIENEKALKFYRREGWKERAYALVKKINLAF